MIYSLKKGGEMKKTTQTSSFFIVVFFILFINFIQPMNKILADSNEVGHYAGMEARIAKLEERVQKLEQLLLSKASEFSNQDNILKHMPNTSEKHLQIAEDWRSIKNWTRVKDGMTFDQVIQILGNPTKKDMLDSDWGKWYYEGYLAEAGTTVSGYIQFMNRKVSGVYPPVY
jgi:hypothetical protein